MHHEQSLNIAQETAIKHGTGPALILAGPGSGKTFVLTHRIKNLIESYHIPPERILVITFTKAASIEMKERFLSLMKNQYLPVTFGTFHAIFFHILQHSYHFKFSNIITEKEKYHYMQGILEQMISEKKQEIINTDLEEIDDTFMGSILSEISNVKNLGLSINAYQATCMEYEEFRTIYLAYKETLKRNRKLDFDDMVLLCYELLKENQQLRTFWHEQYQYILIDEFQDINYMQYSTIKLLVNPTNHIFVVGDDDQSIYGFRGAKPEILKQFKEEFVGTKQLLLNINYRSSANIVNASLKVIEENKNRFLKKIQSHHDQGADIILQAFQSEEEQTANIIHFVLQLKKRNHKFKDIAVIYRTNARAGYLAEQFVLHQIPFIMKEKVNCIYEHFIAKDLISYMTFAASHNRSDFFRIMNKPKRYLCRSACSETKIDFHKMQYYYQNKPYMRERILKLQYDTERILQMNPYAAINFIRKGIGYDVYINDLAKNKKVNAQEWFNVLEEIQRQSAAFDTLDLWLGHIKNLEEELLSNKKEEVKDGITILTMHGCKGLEYHTVIIPDINDNMIPNKKAESIEDIEEERRLFYVAMTRAKEKLVLFYINQKETLPSRFLNSLIEEKKADINQPLQ